MNRIPRPSSGILQRSALMLTLVGAAVAPLPTAAAAQIGLPVGSTPEAVVLEDLAGEPVDLGGIMGQKPALFEFWATWCPLCEELEPELAAAHERFGDRVAFIQVAVSVNQSPESIREHRAEHPSPARVLWDTEGRAVRAFKTPSTSYVVILDAAGRVVYTGSGGDQDLTAALAEMLGS